MMVAPEAYSGRRVRVSGVYGLLMTSSGYFTLDQGDLSADVYYAKIPSDQKRAVLREKTAEGKAVVVEGTVECDGEEINIHADTVLLQ
jgi:hypothetical protein